MMTRDWPSTIVALLVTALLATAAGCGQIRRAEAQAEAARRHAEQARMEAEQQRAVAEAAAKQANEKQAVTEREAREELQKAQAALTAAESAQLKADKADKRAEDADQKRRLAEEALQKQVDLAAMEKDRAESQLKRAEQLQIKLDEVDSLLNALKKSSDEFEAKAMDQQAQAESARRELAKLSAELRTVRQTMLKEKKLANDTLIRTVNQRDELNRDLDVARKYVTESRQQITRLEKGIKAVRELLSSNVSTSEQDDDDPLNVQTTLKQAIEKLNALIEADQSLNE